jgi:hypothetical protein
VKRLVYFFDLSLHQELHVERDLAAGPGNKPEKAADFGDSIAHGVPGDCRHGEFQLFHQLGLRRETAAAERGQGTGGAAELANQNARAQLIETLAMPFERGEQGCHFVAEGNRDCLL